MVVAHTPSCRPRGGSLRGLGRVTGGARLAHLQSLDRRSIFLASNLSAVSKPASRSSPSLRICSTTSARQRLARPLARRLDRALRRPGAAEGS